MKAEEAKKNSSAGRGALQDKRKSSIAVAETVVES